MRTSNASRRELLSFLDRIEIFNIESEIDRLVGSPWELSDSTSYKLSLAPLHLAYPVYDQMVRQITRLDDIRTRRIQNLTVDSLGLIAVDLSLLSPQQSGSQLASSIIRYFNAREILDLGVFLLAQQPLFPQTPERWDELRHDIASRRGALAISAVGLGALFEAGALSNSGTLKRCRDDKCSLGWYGSFSRLGHRLRPILRGGLTTRLPKLELSAGLVENVRPGEAGARTVAEMAIRESWLGRFTNVAGWDSFFEGALRRVVLAESGYQEEWFTARGGLFVKRERPFRLRAITLRGSTEVESDLTGSLRYALSFGVDYSKTGLSAVVQSSRTNVLRDGVLAPEMRTALLVAGTVESPQDYFLRGMNAHGWRLRESWNHLVEREAERRQAEAELRVLAAGKTGSREWQSLSETLRRLSAESEGHRMRVATLLGEYLEGRRLVYSIKRWKTSPDGTHGPLDGEMLQAATAAVFARLAELALFLEGAQGTLANLRDQYTRISESALAVDASQAMVRRQAEEDLAAVDRQWRRASDSVTEALRLYEYYLASTRRIAAAAGGLLAARHSEPLDSRTLRRLLTLVAQPFY
ncbi:MAG: hypothetical protein JXP73_18455 [Deltaproteobacteria bacterium]|nr:hypothetical protein [Deltaproteobacteria bacterium]